MESTATFERAVELHRQGQYSHADEVCQHVLRAQPRHYGALHLQGLMALKAGDIARGTDLIERSLRIEPQQPAAHSNLGNARLQSGDFARALDHFERALALAPQYGLAWHNRANALRALNRPADAVVGFQRAAELMPGNTGPLLNWAVTLLDLERPAEAQTILERLLAAQPNNAEALRNYGLTLMRLDRKQTAIDYLRRAATLAPEDPEAHFALGNVLLQTKSPLEATASFDRALQLAPHHLGALTNRGTSLRERMHPEEALRDFEQVLRQTPDSAIAWNNCGNAWLLLRQADRAVEHLERALQLRPDYRDALINLGMARLVQRRAGEALRLFDQALSMGTPTPELVLGRYHAFTVLKRDEDALAALLQLQQLAPEFDFLSGMLVQARLTRCDWSEHSRDYLEQREGVLRNRRIINPMSFLALEGTAAMQLRCAQIYLASEIVEQVTPMSTQGYGHQRIRVAYVSADLRAHAVSYLMAGVFEHHDRSRFEIIGISLRPPDDSPMGQRVKAAFDRFIDVSARSDRDVAQLLRDLEIDIAVDLMGYTEDARPAVFALRPAPVQVNYIGFPGTVGAPFLDYIIADEFVIPENCRQHYSEHAAYLPDCFQPNDDRREIADLPTREQAGLPADGLVLSCFNNSYKLSPELFDIWCRLLLAAPNSCLWLIEENAQVRENLRAEARKRGIEPDRLVMAQRLPYAQHLARLQWADLFLDTLPFNAGTSASDALWAGVPILTCAGETFASRMAGSLLRAAGLPELVTSDLDAYERLGLQLVADPPSLRKFKRRLTASRRQVPLFDTERYCRHLEAAYRLMWQRAERGEAPSTLWVEPQPLPGTRA